MDEIEFPPKLDRDYIMLTFALHECRRALHALCKVDACSAPTQHPTQSNALVFEPEPVFDSIRLGLHFAANVSKIFWPTSAKRRGERLRSLAKIPEGHMASSRRLRNHIEHIDDRLDKWTEISPRPFMQVEMNVPLMLAAFEPITDGLLESCAVVYNEGSKTVHLFGEVFNLLEMQIGLKELFDLIFAALKELEADPSFRGVRPAQ